jgi:hypothetical protein
MIRINIEEIKKCENYSIKDFEIIRQIELFSKETDDNSLNCKINPYAIFNMHYPESKIINTYSQVDNKTDII